jgi:endonuclease YncB( thermonuclease family)
MEDLKLKFSKYDEKTPEFSLKGLATYARLVGIYDGDSVNLILPVGDRYCKFAARLVGIDTCEMKNNNKEAQAIARQARDRLVELCIGQKPVSTSHDPELAEKEKKTWIKKQLHDNVCLVYVKAGDLDKYARVLCELSKDESSESFSDILLRDKLAYPYMGQTKLEVEDQLAYLRSS